MKYEFIIPGEPMGKERPRFSHVGKYVHTYTPPKTVRYEKKVGKVSSKSTKVFMHSKVL